MSTLLDPVTGELCFWHHVFLGPLDTPTWRRTLDVRAYEPGRLTIRRYYLPAGRT